MKNKSINKSICFLATPTFNFFPLDIFKEFPEYNLHCFFQGSPAFFNNFFNKNPEIITIFNISYEIDQILHYLATNPKKKFVSFDDAFGNGSLGKIISADRKYGIGYVHGVSVRPDNLTKRFKNLESSEIDLYFSLLANSIEKYLKKVKPKIILISAIAGSFNYLLSLVGKKLNIKVLQIVHTRVGSKYMLDDSPIADLKFIENFFNSSKKIKNSKSLSLAASFVSNYQANDFLPDYKRETVDVNGNFDKKNLNAVKFKFLLSNLKIAFRAILGIFYYIISINEFKYKVEQVKRQFWKISCVARAFIPLYFTPYCYNFANSKYIFFPLHVDPESSTMVLTPYLTNQLYLIELLSKIMPSNMLLIVKEHIPMIGRRKISFYDSIKSIPRVRLADPFISASSLIKNSSLVCGISGTTVLEAILNKKSHLLLGDAPFKPIAKPHIWNGNIYDLESYLLHALNSKEINVASLKRYFSIIFDNSFEISQQALWGSYQALSSAEKDKNLKGIQAKLKKYLDC